MTAVAGPRLRVAVIGCGKVSQNVHLPALAKSSTCELVALCDASGEVVAGVARRYSIDRTYTSVDPLLRDDVVEAVLIAVGDPFHVEVAVKALNAGKHVLVEKPLGTSSAECAPLRDAVRRTGLVLQIGVMKRSDPGLEYARRAINELDGVLSFGIWYRASADPYVDEGTTFLPVIRDSAYTRPPYKLDRQPYYLAGHGAHLFDNVRYLVGEPTGVQARLAVHGGTYAWHGLLDLAGGALGHFDLVVYTESDWSEGLVVYGTRGSVHVDSPNPFYLRPSTVRVFDAGGRTWRQPYFAEGDPYQRQLDAFAASALQGAAPIASVDDGIAALELIEAVATSAASSGAAVALARG
jgi:predicted dehydrogenase